MAFPISRNVQRYFERAWLASRLQSFPTFGGTTAAPNSCGGTSGGETGASGQTGDGTTTASGGTAGGESETTGGGTTGEGGGETVGGGSTPIPDVCPQRGHGCVALILDYSKAKTFEVDFQDIADNLSKVCVVDYVTPEFKPDPTPDTDPKVADEINAYNAAQQKLVDDAISRHVRRLAFGAEVTIEMINGHGNHSGLCGEVGAESGPGVKRGNLELEEPNLAAANTLPQVKFSGARPLDGLTRRRAWRASDSAAPCLNNKERPRKRLAPSIKMPMQTCSPRKLVRLHTPVPRPSSVCRSRRSPTLPFR